MHHGKDEIPFTVLHWFIMGTLAVLGYQAYVWARYGHWHSITVSDLFMAAQTDRPAVHWGGMQQLIDWWVETAVAWNLLFAGVAAALVVLAVHGRTRWA